MFDHLRLAAVLGMVGALNMFLPYGMRGDQTDDGAPVDGGSRIEVFLVTLGPGARFWERFGHNAIWIRDPERGIDTLYNYGVFDFEDENFVLNFIQGRMQYRLATQQPRASFAWYRRLNRTIVVQDLNLTPSQKVELRDFLAWNHLPENRFYRYDYYRDNCSTRVRDALDRVLGGQIRSQTDSLSNGTTFRFHTQRLTANDVPYYTALMLATGNPVDRPISLWDEMFIPMHMQEYLRDVTVRDSSGNDVPLIASEQVLYTSTLSPAPAQPPAWMMGYLAVGVAVGAIVLGLAVGAPRRGIFRFCLAVVSCVWALVVGLGGVVLFHLWAFTDHTVAYWNENVMFLTPLALPLIVVGPAAVYGKAWAVRPAAWLAAVIAGMSVVGWIAQILPGLDQVNGQVIALMLPVNLAAAAAVWGVTGRKWKQEPARSR